MGGVRLRQVALVAHDLEAVVTALHDQLGITEEPYADPGVAVFGLHNAVMALGDTFLEVVSPVQPETAAGRYLERRHGDGGYMAIFQVDDLVAARRRIAELGIRVVWQADHEDIAGTHLHPKDVPGALVSIDWAQPPGSWRWAGPAWTRARPAAPPGGIVGVTVESERPVELAQRWSEVLGRSWTAQGKEAAIALDGGAVHFVYPVDDRGEGICGIEVALRGTRGREVEVGGVRLALRPLAP